MYAIVRRKDVFYRLSSLPMPEEQAPPAASGEGGETHVTPTAAASTASGGDEGDQRTHGEGEEGKGESKREGEKAEAGAAASTDISAHTQGTDPVADATRAQSGEGDEEGAEVEAGTAAEGSDTAAAAAAPAAPAPPAFVATAEWVREWQGRLPLYTVTRLLQFLAPQVEALCTREDGASTREDEVIDFLKSTTMVGLLPVPHPIVVRRYNPNQYTNLWFTTFLWGVVFLQNQRASRARLPSPAPGPRHVPLTARPSSPVSA